MQKAEKKLESKKYISPSNLFTTRDKAKKKVFLQTYSYIGTLFASSVGQRRNKRGEGAMIRIITLERARGQTVSRKQEQQVRWDA